MTDMEMRQFRLGCAHAASRAGGTPEDTVRLAKMLYEWVVQSDRTSVALVQPGARDTGK